MQPIAIVGSGRVATALGKALRNAGVPIAFIAGRNRGRVDALAHDLAATPAEVEQLGGRVLVAVADDAVPGTLARLSRAETVLHTSGALGHIALDCVASGVLHPLQTVPDESARFAHTTFAYGGDPDAEQFALEIINILQANPLPIPPNAWAHYHAGAVMAANYQCALIDSALELFRRAGITSDVALCALEPLARASFDNIFRLGPAAALTGPIARQDHGTILKHLRALTDVHPDTASLYRVAGLRTLPLLSAAHDTLRNLLEAAQ